jgi:hypothetical protein
MTLRSIPTVEYRINHSEDGKVSDIFKKALLSLNLALHKTFKGTKYKKFAILFFVDNSKTESVFRITCPEIEFMTNFQKFVEEAYSVEEVKQTFESIRSIFSEIIDKIPLEKYRAETIVYDEQARKITLGEEFLHMDVTTTSGLLFF